MDKKVDKQAIIDEYLLGCFTYRELEKKHGVSRQTINEWVLDYQGIPRSKTIHRQKANLAAHERGTKRRKNTSVTTGGVGVAKATGAGAVAQ